MSFWIKRLVTKLYSRPYIIVTNTVTGVVSISIADVLQQNLEYGWSRAVIPQLNASTSNGTSENTQFVCDTQRTKNMMFAGVYFSLFGHYWYSFLDRRFPPKARNSVRNKLLAEVAMGPTLVSSVFFIVGNLKGQSYSQCWQYMKSNFAIICGVEWLVYIPLQWLNFLFIPAQFRYLYVAMISIGYDTFLSYILHRNERYQEILLRKTEDRQELGD